LTIWAFDVRTIRRTTQFKKDVKRQQKTGKSFSDFCQIIVDLANGKSLAAKHHDHSLAGAFKGSRECHVEPDWLLIYEIDDSNLILIRTGSHSDLFG
jgi:mRNA interferase YafQ